MSRSARERRRQEDAKNRGPQTNPRNEESRSPKEVATPTSSRRRFLRDRSVRARVAVLVLLPLLATLALGSVVVKISLDQASAAAGAERLTAVGIDAEKVKNRVNNERAAWQFAVMSGNEQDIEDVNQTQALTDQAIEDFNASLQRLGNADFGRNLANMLRLMKDDLADHEANRQLENKSALWDAYVHAADRAQQVTSAVSRIIVHERELGTNLTRAEAGARDATNEARLIAGITAGAVLLVVVLTTLLTLFVARSIIGPLRRLRASAHSTATTNLPTLVDRIQQDGPAITRQAGVAARVEGRDEIGQVATAFNEVYATAVRVAGEQALLRQNLDTIVVNLSRRTQSLVDRQLGEIEGLESQERDPDQLSTLFRIDHIATRVRRHADSLLILAGVEEMRRQIPSTPILDVVRGAVGEVEQYTRVEFGVMPTDLVVSSAVHDTAHLLAELIDNATEFSAPSTPVTLTSQPLLGGGLRIQVTDNGLGMSPDQIAELNSRLASPGDIDVAASRTLGLYVVARLAARHGIQVRLERGTNSGTVAYVDLPSSIVLSPLDTTEGVIPAVTDAQTNQAATPSVLAQSAQGNPANSVDQPRFGEQPPQRMPAVPAQPSTFGDHPSGPVRPVSDQPTGPIRQPVNRPSGQIRTPQNPSPENAPVPQPATAREHAPSTERGLEVSRPKLNGHSDTPVYDAVHSAWFNKSRMPNNWKSPADEGYRRAAAALRAAEESSAISRPQPPTQQVHGSYVTSSTPLAPQSPPPVFDQGQHQHRSAPASRPPAPTPAEQRASGLPVRQKGASLLPGSISDVPSPAPPPSPQPEEAPSQQLDVARVASTLSSLQRGVSRGREETGGWVPKRPGGPERSTS